MEAKYEHLMTDADFERALEALEQDGETEVSDLLRAMNENRIISWEEAERILCESSNEPVKSSLPQQTRPTEPDNDTDVDQSIRRLLQNDPKLVEINLNNMKRTPIPQIKRILEAMRENTFLEKISLANMGLYDMDVAPLIDVIEDNETLRAVNVETNYLSGDFFAKLMRAALKNQTLEEVKAVNQGVSFSTSAEHDIIDAVFQNRGLTKVSINLRLPEGRHKIEQATIRNQEIRRILRRQAIEASRAAEAAAEAKATRMADISPGKISTTGKPPTKKQQMVMQKTAVNNQPTTSEARFTKPMINPKRVENVPPSRLSEKPVLKRLKNPIDVSEEDYRSEINETPKSPLSIPPAILQRKRQEAESESDSQADLQRATKAHRSIFSSSGGTSGAEYPEDDDDGNYRPPSSPTKPKTIVRKLSTDIETMYAKNTNAEGKVAYIPEAPVGRASLIAKRFEKKEASARKEAERTARRSSAIKKPSDFKFNVATVMPSGSVENRVREESKTGEIIRRENGLKTTRQEEDEEEIKNTEEPSTKPVSKWRQKKNEEMLAHAEEDKRDACAAEENELELKRKLDSEAQALRDKLHEIEAQREKLLKRANADRTPKRRLEKSKTVDESKTRPPLSAWRASKADGMESLQNGFQHVEEGEETLDVKTPHSPTSGSLAQQSEIPELEAAPRAYEPLTTRPRKVYGDLRKRNEKLALKTEEKEVPLRKRVEEKRRVDGLEEKKRNRSLEKRKKVEPNIERIPTRPKKNSEELLGQKKTDENKDERPNKLLDERSVKLRKEDFFAETRKTNEDAESRAYIPLTTRPKRTLKCPRELDSRKEASNAADKEKLLQHELEISTQLQIENEPEQHLKLSVESEESKTEFESSSQTGVDSGRTEQQREYIPLTTRPKRAPPVPALKTSRDINIMKQLRR